MMPPLLIWLSGVLFALFHSLTATVACKLWCYQHGLREPHYRLAYSLLATLLTVGWLLWIHQLTDQPLYHITGWASYLLHAIQLAGLLLAAAAFRPIDSAAFLGLRAAPTSGDPFITSGIYRHLRHPMYAGVGLMLIAAPMQSLNSLHFSLMILTYFIIGSRFEEQRMLAQHSEYADYRSQVPSFIPRP
ncbi:MAG: isoprenylcysteine carboxylmethyltransferase family protein [Mariprofundales bacterium]